MSSLPVQATRRWVAWVASNIAMRAHRRSGATFIRTWASPGQILARARSANDIRSVCRRAPSDLHASYVAWQGYLQFLGKCFRLGRPGTLATNRRPASAKAWRVPPSP